MAVYEFFVNGEDRIHRLEVLRSLIPCVNGKVLSVVPFAQGWLVVFLAPVQNVWMPLQAGPYQWFFFQLAPFLLPGFGHDFAKQVPLQS